jgi:hypothetical protein
MAKKNWVPKNAREVVLKGFNLAEGFSIYEEEFTGASTVLHRGTFEPDGTDLEIPFIAKISYGKPRPVAQGDRS